MLMTPTTILAISFAGLAFGVVLTWWGRRGRPIDEHPVCRKCRFDLVGRPPGSERCPECGADLGQRRAIAVGNRKPRLSAIIIGGCIVLLALCVFGGWGWIRFRYVKEADKPTWLVLLDAKSKDAALRAGAFSELFRREKIGDLSEAQCNAYIDCLAAEDHSLNGYAQNDAMDQLYGLGLRRPRAIQALVAELRVPDPPPDPEDAHLAFGMRWPTRGEYAARLLDDLGTPGWNAMLNEVGAGSPWVLKHCLYVGDLGDKMKDERIAELLVKALSSPDKVLADRAEGAIVDSAVTGSVRFPAAPALAGLSDPHPKTRITCLSLLGHLDTSPPLDALLPLLHDPDPEVQDNAERELEGCYEWTTDISAVPPLIRILGDTHDFRQKYAVNALGYFRTRESISALALALKEDDLCLDAIDSLNRICSETTFNAVIDVLDEVPEVFHERVEALADRLCDGNYKNTPYWQKHVAMKHVN